MTARLPKPRKNGSAQNGENNRGEQGTSARSVRYAFQQARLHGSRALLVIELHSTQRAHPTRARRPVQSDQKPASNAEVRAGHDRCRGRLRDCPWPVFQHRKAEELDRLSSASPMARSRSTGTFCRTKRPKPNRKAVCRCSGPNFSAEIMGESSTAVRPRMFR